MNGFPLAARAAVFLWPATTSRAALPTPVVAAISAIMLTTSAGDGARKKRRLSLFPILTSPS